MEIGEVERTQVVEWPTSRAQCSLAEKPFGMNTVPRPVDFHPGDAFKGKEEPPRMTRRPLPDGSGKKEKAKGDRFARDGNPLHADLPCAGTVPRRTENPDLRPGVGK
jgi:hypothetical protein